MVRVMSESVEERIRKLVPKNHYGFYKRVYEINKKSKFQWLCFSRKCISNPFVIQHLQTKQKGLCSVCGRFLNDSLVVHHLDYANVCSMAKCKEDLLPIPNPTGKRPGRNDLVPDCEKCATSNGHSFEECMCRLVLVHKRCHMEIHYYQRHLSICENATAPDMHSCP